MSLAIIGTVAAVGGLALSAYSVSQAGKGGGGGTVTETIQGHAAADMALDQYNTYLRDFKPTEQKFIADIVKPTTTEEAKQMGKVNADIAQNSAIPAGDPNRLIKNPDRFAQTADVLSKAQNNAEQAVQAKQLAGEQAIVDIGLHKASNAQLGMDSLAADAEKRAISGKQRDVDKNGQIINSIGSGIGAIGAIAKNWPTTTSQPWNGSSGTVDNYDPYTTYVPDAPGPGPYAIEPTILT